ncbi:MAG TPA: M20/M25/M40 family metallo-hydrolase [Actinocrinis sp.]|uniref:M20/M25/M40 family metallo-hydrolase n=1 Tax=Actinocrinis sp. TaxID=1920516 RepID=UPI002D58EAEF|nr:M20/M25/M40 family metallo-hydrolase [Actinocrinis sp.]HZU56624.1 M20/M25/M40 family metallo-hydrolase [Actinocrinis sp.]
MDAHTIRRLVDELWTRSALPSLAEFVRIPALSPLYDASWAANGHLQAATEHVGAWIKARALPGARIEALTLEGRSPLLIADIPATAGAAARNAGTVILYGHLDKQPPLDGWSAGLEPWKPVLRDGRLYGRGAADDGYSGYAATTALEAVRAAGGEHARTVILLETCEESGSTDLPAYLSLLSERLGDVSLLVCLDIGGIDYERLWLTDSLRGLVQLTVTARVLETPQHSGLAGGIVPDPFRILRHLLDRVEDAASGEIKIPAMHVALPPERRTAARDAAALAPGLIAGRFPMVAPLPAADADDAELLLNNTWRPALTVTGAAGLPRPADAGNVLHSAASLKLSFRVPPTADAPAALAALEKTLTRDVPAGAKVELSDRLTMNGWAAPAPAPWLRAALARVGAEVFGRPHAVLGCGGSVPFMELLGRRYPNADFLATGVLGADSNAHGPDEWLNIAFAQRVTEAVAHILDAHARK